MTLLDKHVHELNLQCEFIQFFYVIQQHNIQSSEMSTNCLMSSMHIILLDHVSCQCKLFLHKIRSECSETVLLWSFLSSQSYGSLIFSTTTWKNQSFVCEKACCYISGLECLYSTHYLQTHSQNCRQCKHTFVLKENRPKIHSISVHHHKAVLPSITLMRTRPKIPRHTK